MDAQVKELTDKLTALEHQLQNQSGANASVTVSSTTTPGQSTVKVPWERKLQKSGLEMLPVPLLVRQTLMLWTFYSTTWMV